MERKQVEPSESAGSASLVFAEMIKDACYTFLSVHDLVPLTRNQPICISGFEKLTSL